MIVIKSWQDLRHFGIDCLTGESCRIGVRLLCDLSLTGRRLYSEVVGVTPEDHTYRRNWNGSPHSIIPRDYDGVAAFTNAASHESHGVSYRSEEPIASANIPTNLFATLAVMCPMLHFQQCQCVVVESNVKYGDQIFYVMFTKDLPQECRDDIVKVREFIDDMCSNHVVWWNPLTIAREHCREERVNINNTHQMTRRIE